MNIKSSDSIFNVTVFFTLSITVIFLTNLTSPKKSNHLCESKQIENVFDCPFRFYDPKLSRFIHADIKTPANYSVGLNRLAYVNNNPFKYTDPTGHIPHDVLDNTKALFKDLTESGNHLILQVDQALYKSIESIVPSDSDFKSDPIGSVVSVFGMVTGVGGGIGRAADDAVQTALRQQRKNLVNLRRNTRRNILESLNYAEGVVNNTGKNLVVVNDVAKNLIDDISVQEARQYARQRAIYQLTHEGAYEIDHLASVMSNGLRAELNNPGSLQAHTSLPGRFKPEAVEEFANSWLADALPGFTVRRGNVQIVPKLSGTGGRPIRAQRTFHFSFSLDDQNFSFSVRVRYSGDDYRRLRYELAEEGTMHLPENFPPMELGPGIRVRGD